MIKALTKIAAIGAVLLPVMASAQDPEPTGPFGGNITGLVTLTNDYMFRGISQTVNAPALQAGLNYDFAPVDLGGTSFVPYFGFWGSSIRFAPEQGESVEIDLLPGIKGKLLNDQLSYDVGLTLYRYPGANNNSFKYDEGRVSLGWDFGFAAVTGLFAYSPDFFGRSGDGYYINGAVSIPLGTYGAATPKIFGSVGHQWIEKNSVFNTPDYTDYQFGIGVNAWTLDFSVAWIGSTIDRDECFSPAPGAAAGERICDGRVVFGISKTF